MRLRLKVRELFSAHDLAEEMLALGRLYELFAFVHSLDAPDRKSVEPAYRAYYLSILVRDPGGWRENGRDPFEDVSFPELECIAVAYNSPGVHEVRGIAEGIRSIFEVVRDVIFLKRSREIHELEALHHLERIKYATVERVERMANMLRDNGVSLETTQKFVLKACNDIATLDRLAERRGVIGLELIDENETILESTAVQPK